MDEQVFEQYDKTIRSLMKKRQKAFLNGRTKRIISLDREIARLELEIDELFVSH